MFPFEQFSFEMLVVFAIGLMVLGPKDLPVVMRKIGQFVSKMRGMAAEFRASFDELARQSELDELRKEVEALRSGVSLTDSAPAADPTYDYKPFDDAAAGLDGSGFASADSPAIGEAPVMAEGLPPAAAEIPPAKAPRKSRAKTAPAVAPEPAAESASQVAAPKPARKPRAAAAPAKTVSPAKTIAPKVAAKRAPAERAPAKGASAKSAAE